MGSRPTGNKSPESVPLDFYVLSFRAVFGGAVEGDICDFGVCNGNLKAIPKIAKLRLVQFLLLMCNIFAFACFSQSVTFDGFCENNGWATLMKKRRVISCVDFFWVMSSHS